MTTETDRNRKIRHRRDSLREAAGILTILVLTFSAEPVVPWISIGVGIAVLGILVRLWASGYVKKNHELATRGPYAWVRHPLYLGNVLIATGFSMAAHLWWGYILVAAVVLIFYPTTIRQEDAKIRRLFGPVWKEWRKSTMALIPSLRPYRKGSLGYWSLAYSLRLNGEPLIAIALLVLLMVLSLRA